MAGAKRVPKGKQTKSQGTASATIRWDIPPEKLADALEIYGDNFLDAVFALATDYANIIEEYAKQNARWRDRTTHARAGLTCRAFKRDAGILLVLFHAMDYGVWLEVAHAGKYAIIMETLGIMGPQLLAEIDQLIG